MAGQGRAALKVVRLKGDRYILQNAHSLCHLGSSLPAKPLTSIRKLPKVWREYGVLTGGTGRPQ